MLLLSLILVRSGVSSTLGPGRGAWKKGNPQKLGLIPSKLVQAAQQYVLFVCFLRTFFGEKEPATLGEPTWDAVGDSTTLVVVSADIC